MSAPESTIYLCTGVNLNNNYNHTIWFDSREAQIAWFKSKVVKTFTAYTYLRRNWSIKVDHATAGSDQPWSYLFFDNGWKTYYYFINRVEYINEHTVELFIELDVMQTYLVGRDYSLLPCFVEREHSKTDKIGDNIIDEGLELGEYVTIAEENIDLNDYMILILATAHPVIASNQPGELVPSMGYSYDNVFRGLGVYAVKLSNTTQLRTLLNKLSEAGNADCITAMWMYPGELVELGNLEECVYTVSGSKKFSKELARNEVLDGAYTPVNKKLFTYPYNYLYVTNNYGQSVAYPYEYFGIPSEPVLRIAGSVSPDATARLYPLNYKGLAHNYESGVTLGSFPTCAWDSDIYKMWLAQNQHQNNLGISLSSMKVAAGLVTAGAAIAAAPASGGTSLGALTGPTLSALIGAAKGANLAALGGGALTAYSGATEIAQLMALKADKEITPPEARGNYSATVNMATGYQTFTIMKKCVTKETAKRIDKYFTMFGYKTNKVKTPNVRARSNWTYTKTVGCNIAGNLVTEDKRKIESIFDRGITFWVNGDALGDYGYPNTCLPENEGLEEE